MRDDGHLQLIPTVLLPYVRILWVKYKRTARARKLSPSRDPSNQAVNGVPMTDADRLLIDDRLSSSEVM